jgi:lipocalin
MKALFPLLAFLLVTAPLMANAYSVNETQTVPYVDLSRYLGTWYNVASKPTKFEHD